jgi:hypothetical protein
MWPVEAAPYYSDFNKFYDYSPDGGKWRFRFDLRGIGTVVMWGLEQMRSLRFVSNCFAKEDVFGRARKYNFSPS